MSAKGLLCGVISVAAAVITLIFLMFCQGDMFFMSFITPVIDIIALFFAVSKIKNGDGTSDALAMISAAIAGVAFILSIPSFICAIRYCAGA